MTLPFRNLLVSLFLLGFGVAVSAASNVPVVVELFTSQGCSSCPPAESLLGELANKSNVVALAYHVDYWDRLGWKDPFSIPQAAERQRGYVRKLAKSGAFTPQAVVSGDTSVVGSNRAALLEAVGEDRDALAIELSRNGRTLLIDFLEPWRGRMDVHVISYLNEATTRVGSGENARRTLRQHNIVRSIQRLGTWDGRPQQMKFSLASVPRDATSIAVLLQLPGQGAIAGAATLPLG